MVAACGSHVLQTRVGGLQKISELDILLEEYCKNMLTFSRACLGPGKHSGGWLASCRCTFGLLSKALQCLLDVPPNIVLLP